MLNLIKLKKWTENTPLDGDSNADVIMISPHLIMAIEDISPDRKNNYGRRTRIDYMSATGPTVALVQETPDEIMLQLKAVLTLQRNKMQPKSQEGDTERERMPGTSCP